VGRSGISKTCRNQMALDRRKEGGCMKAFLQNTWKHRAHVLMSLPVVLILFFFNYVPMAGLVLAFKKFDYKRGLWLSS
jgi:ABC-type polysaccharide transport system permease subunit